MRLLQRWRQMLRRRDGDRAVLDEELEGHLEFLQQELLAKGHSAEAAHREALRQFGNPTRVREESREVFSFGRVEMFLRDVRYAVRSLRRAPVLVAVAALSLGLGVGANLVLFSTVRSVFFAMPTANEPERLVRLRLNHDSQSSYAVLRAVRASGAVADVVGHRETQVNWRDGDTEREALAQIVTPNYFESVGGAAAFGRVFTSMDKSVVVVSHAFWRRALAADTGVLSREIVINGQSRAVLGVLPEDYRSMLGLGMAADVYLPAEDGEREDARFAMVGRLHAHQAPEHGRQALVAIGDALRAQFAPHDSRFASDWRVEGPRDIDRIGSVGGSGIVVFAVLLLVLSSLVLLVACANVANLLLVRASMRRREIAIRLAIGASRWQITAQLLAEGAVLSAMGMCVGLLLCQGAILQIRNLDIGFGVPVSLRPAFDTHLVGFTLVLGVACTMLSSLIPAIRSGRRDLTSTLRSDQMAGTGPRWVTLRSVLVSGQIAASVVLLLCAALFYRGLQLAQGVQPGYDVDHTLTVRLRDPQAPIRVEEALDRLAGIPGLQSVGAAERIPLTFSGQATDVYLEGSEASRGFRVRQSNVTSDYFQTLGVRLLAGEGFVEGERRPVVMVNQLLARRRFGEDNAVGRRLMYRMRNGVVPLEIVGVVADTKYFSLGEEPQEILYLPLAQKQDTLHLFARTKGPAAALVEPVRKRLQAFSPSALVEVNTLRTTIGGTLLPNKIGSRLLAVLGAVGLAMAVVGLYGVLSYAVSLRTAEFGIRLALGATRVSIVGMVVRHSLLLLACGGVVGIGLAWAATKPLSQLLVSGIRADDPVAVGAVMAIVATVGVIAALIPAARVLRIDPLRTLRFE
ncbi:MAG TPA: FtsX-like permease family protein [Bryobacteraceae bacterium]|nr:FtsX-like permease family protein [Bryobacteraceae bacterium]